MNDQDLQDEINKRLTLNWLIQGAAQHAGMTFHHLVRDELDTLNPRLLLLYDQYALINLLQYWQPDASMLFGWPPRFWKRAASKPKHPFFHHPLLSKYGGTLAEAGRQRALERCKEKGITRVPLLFSSQAVALISRLQIAEMPYQLRLIELAKHSTSAIWGIPINRLAGSFGKGFDRDTRIRVRNFREMVWHVSIVGYGCVVRRGDSLAVVGRGTNWQLLTKELVKGTAELICLHGLNTWDDETYRRVMDATDRLGYEPWMLQTGGELWRRLLAVIPEGRFLAEVLMYLARLTPKSLESLVSSVIDEPQLARELLLAMETNAEARAYPAD
jgi:hypothetical protein